MPADIDNIPQYSVEELKQVLENETATVVDVRTEAEYQGGHIPGVPLMPMQAIQTWAPSLDPTISYVFVCRSGARSQSVAQHLQTIGFTQVGNFTGGMLVWDGPVETE